MPVVSVGTFESYIMGSPCICEVMVDALTFTEEAGVLALVAPRAIKMCNHNKDSNPAFFPSEMVRSYNNAKSFDAELKRNELRDILGVSEKSILKNVHEYSKTNGWDRFALETSDNKLIPVLLRSPSNNSKEFVIVSNPDGKDNLSTSLAWASTCQVSLTGAMYHWQLPLAVKTLHSSTR